MNWLSPHNHIFRRSAERIQREISGGLNEPEAARSTGHRYKPAMAEIRWSMPTRRLSTSAFTCDVAREDEA